MHGILGVGRIRSTVQQAESEQAALVGEVQHDVPNQTMRGGEGAKFFAPAFSAAVHHKANASERGHR